MCSITITNHSLPFNELVVEIDKNDTNEMMFNY